MTDDESFDELMAQSSLGSAGARGLRERTSPDVARLVLRMVELRHLLDSASSDIDPLTLVRVRDELAGAVEELEQTRADKGTALIRVARKLARVGRFDRALECMERAKRTFDEADDWEGSAQVMAMMSAMLLRAGKNARALAALHELSVLLASRRESGAQLGASVDYPRQGPAHPEPHRPRSEAQGEPSGVTRPADRGTPLSPHARLLLAIGAEEGAVDVLTELQWHEEITRLVDEAAGVARLDRERWVTQESKDSLLYVLPEGTRLALLDDFMRALDAGLRAFNYYRVAEARLRVKAVVSVGVARLGSDGVTGVASRLTTHFLNSAPLRTALDQSPGACLVVAVLMPVLQEAMQRAIPGAAFQHVVSERGIRTAAIWFPGVDARPAGLAPGKSMPSEAGTGSRSGADGSPQRDEGV
ncbi:tetratricopeptide repeat protein [Streptomyces sp. UMAF16]|nr:tetratricopeptide repeat protein [Streptomyces sp. UMAF16]